ncbi:MAG: hypothetical protein WAS72_12795, partial [Saprospiraceae bacterium]
ESDSTIPAFLSTHPMNEERKSYLEKAIETTIYESTEHPTLADIFAALKEEVKSTKEVSNELKKQ